MGSDERPRGPDLKGLRRLSAIAKPPKPDRTTDPARVVAFVVAAVVVVAVPWFVFTRIGDSGPARPPDSGARPAAPAAATTPSPTPSEAGIYEVTGDVRCARIRVAPGTDQEIINCLTPGVKLRSDGVQVEKDGFTWLHVDDPFRKVDGWIATRYVRRLP